jgi:hypothetical protein
LQLPKSIGLLSLRELGPSIGDLRSNHRLNLLNIEALAAAVRFQSRVMLSARSPQLEAALEAEGLEISIT